MLILSSTNEVIKIARNGIVYGKTWAIASAILKPLTIGTKPAKKKPKIIKKIVQIRTPSFILLCKIKNKTEEKKTRKAIFLKGIPPKKSLSAFPNKDIERKKTNIEYIKNFSK